VGQKPPLTEKAEAEGPFKKLIHLSRNLNKYKEAYLWGLIPCY